MLAKWELFYLRVILSSQPAPPHAGLASGVTVSGAQANLTEWAHFFQGSLSPQVVPRRTLRAPDAFKGHLEAKLGLEPRPPSLAGTLLFPPQLVCRAPAVQPHLNGPVPSRSSPPGRLAHSLSPLYALCPGFLSGPFPRQRQGPQHRGFNSGSAPDAPGQILSSL